jgi:hypothetical protein
VLHSVITDFAHCLVDPRVRRAAEESAPHVTLTPHNCKHGTVWRDELRLKNHLGFTDAKRPKHVAAESAAPIEADEMVSYRHLLTLGEIMLLTSEERLFHLSLDVR